MKIQKLVAHLQVIVHILSLPGCHMSHMSFSPTRQ
uniref:Uncharacterized protein n=1 Tax=Anguilla anguilla TaxID=7936 RepID=A0A0E9U6R8_ANGAN